MKKKQIKFKLAELFSGPGGLALGAIRSFAENKDTAYGIEPVWANDYDADTCKTYARNIHNGSEESVVCAPVQEIDFKKVPKFDVLLLDFPVMILVLLENKKDLMENLALSTLMESEQ